MNNKISYFFLLIFTCYLTACGPQLKDITIDNVDQMDAKKNNAKSTKVAALMQLEDVEFIKKLNGVRKKAESNVVKIKDNEFKLGEDQVTSLYTSYDFMKKQYNKALQEIKEDMLDKTTRKLIVNHPDKYAKLVNEYFEGGNEALESFNLGLREAFPEDYNGTAGPLASGLLWLINNHGKVKEIFSVLKDQLNGFNNELLDKHFIQKYQFKNWEDIS